MSELSAIKHVKKVFQTAKTLHCGVSELTYEGVVEVLEVIYALEHENASMNEIITDMELKAEYAAATDDMFTILNRLDVNREVKGTVSMFGESIKLIDKLHAEMKALKDQNAVLSERAEKAEILVKQLVDTVYAMNTAQSRGYKVMYSTKLSDLIGKIRSSVSYV